MNPPPARKGGGAAFCGVVFGGGDKAISHVPLIKSVISAVVIDGKYCDYDYASFSYPRVNVMDQCRVGSPSPKPTETNLMNPPRR